MVTASGREEGLGCGVTIWRAANEAARQGYNVREGEKIVKFCATLGEARREAEKWVVRVKSWQRRNAPKAAV